MNKENIFSILWQLWSCIDAKRKKQLNIIYALMILSSFFEVMNIGALVGFLSSITSDRQVLNFFPTAISEKISLYNFDNTKLIILFSIIFGFCLIFSNVLRLLVVWSTTKITLNLGAELSIDAFRRSLYQPYSSHISTNTSEVINGVTNKISATVSSISSIFSIIGNVVMMISILVAIFYINPSIAISAFFGFSFIYLVVTLLTKKRIERYGAIVASQSNVSMKILQESLSGIRDVILDGSQELHVSSYSVSEIRSKASQARIAFIGACPRYGVESLGMILILILACKMVLDSGASNSVIPVLGALALGAQRLLPVVQQVYSSWVSIKGNQSLIQQGVSLLKQPIPSEVINNSARSIDFRSAISIKGVDYRYFIEREWIFQDLNFSINKGSRIGFIGATGAGKSTLLDLIMGLIKPEAGSIFIDDVPLSAISIQSWQQKIAHVPQSIFLSDASVLENIAFGIPRECIDMERVIESAKIAQIHDVVEGWPDGYLTSIGERGIRISGGQRQRIGIARALYKNADVLIFDEATSALDMGTEEKVMNGIYEFSEKSKKKLTVLMIAHRHATLEQCDLIAEVGQGGIISLGSYQDSLKRITS